MHSVSPMPIETDPEWADPEGLANGQMVCEGTVRTAVEQDRLVPCADGQDRCRRCRKQLRGGQTGDVQPY